jgi:hypothetical protein
MRGNVHASQDLEVNQRGNIGSDGSDDATHAAADSSYQKHHGPDLELRRSEEILVGQRVKARHGRTSAAIYNTS